VTPTLRLPLAPLIALVLPVLATRRDARPRHSPELVGEVLEVIKKLAGAVRS
jgi:ABC-type histidine transport system ATPase subunit